MYLPFTPVMADMWRASTGLAARAAAPDIVESILATGLGGKLVCVFVVCGITAGVSTDGTRWVHAIFVTY